LIALTSSIYFLAQLLRNLDNNLRLFHLLLILINLSNIFTITCNLTRMVPEFHAKTAINSNLLCIRGCPGRPVCRCTHLTTYLQFMGFNLISDLRIKLFTDKNSILYLSVVDIYIFLYYWNLYKQFKILLKSKKKKKNTY